MLYNPPTGATGANDPYVGKNPTAGTQGSKIPPAVPEFTQREIVAAIVEAGIPPTNTDLKQLMRAIRSGRMSIYQDVGTPNAIIAASTTAHTTYVPGMPLCVKLGNDVTGATTINLDGLGVLPVVFPGGGPLQRFDYLAGDLIAGRINNSGTAFVALSPINGLLIDTAITRSVHGVGAHFVDLNQARAWLNRRRIAATGSVTFQLASGIGGNRYVYTSDFYFSHPDGARVSILGQPIGGVLPSPGALSYTGSSISARTADTITNLALLRNVYATEIVFAGGARFTGDGTLGNVQDLLITTDGSANVDAFTWNTGAASLNRVAIVSASRRGFFAFGGRIGISGTCYALGCGTYGASAESGGNLALADGATLVCSSNGSQGLFCNASLVGPVGASTSGGVYARGNGSDGVAAINAGTINLPSTAISRDNGNNGFTADSGSTVRVAGTLSSGNGAAAYYSGLKAGVDASNTTGTANGTFGYIALNGGFLLRTGGAATGASAAASPTVGSTGNNNAYIA